MTLWFQSLPSTIFIIPGHSESIQSLADLHGRSWGSLAALSYFYSSSTDIAPRLSSKFTGWSEGKLRTPENTQGRPTAKGLQKGRRQRPAGGRPRSSSVRRWSFEMEELETQNLPTAGWGRGPFPTWGKRGSCQRRRAAGRGSSVPRRGGGGGRGQSGASGPLRPPLPVPEEEPRPGGTPPPP